MYLRYSYQTFKLWYNFKVNLYGSSWETDMLNVSSILEFFLKTESLQFWVSKTLYKHTVKYQEKRHWSMDPNCGNITPSKFNFKFYQKLTCKSTVCKRSKQVLKFQIRLKGSRNRVLNRLNEKEQERELFQQPTNTLFFQQWLVRLLKLISWVIPENYGLPLFHCYPPVCSRDWKLNCHLEKHNYDDYFFFF